MVQSPTEPVLILLKLGLVVGLVVASPIILWQASNGTPLHSFGANDQPLRALAFGAGDEVLAAAGEDQIVRLWRVEDGTLLQSLEGARAPLASLAFNASGTRLASGTSQGTVQVWAVAP